MHVYLILCICCVQWVMRVLLQQRKRGYEGLEYFRDLLTFSYHGYPTYFYTSANIPLISGFHVLEELTGSWSIQHVELHIQHALLVLNLRS